MTFKEALSMVEKDADVQMVRKLWLNMAPTIEHSAAILSIEDVLADDWELKKRISHRKEYNIRVWLDDAEIPANVSKTTWLKGKMLYTNIPGMEVLSVTEVEYKKQKDAWDGYDPNKYPMGGA